MVKLVGNYNALKTTHSDNKAEKKHFINTKLCCAFNVVIKNVKVTTNTINLFPKNNYEKDIFPKKYIFLEKIT